MSLSTPVPSTEYFQRKLPVYYFILLRSICPSEPLIPLLIFHVEWTMLS